ncbi:MAG: MFS transporter [Fluviicola sp. XM-24bin1]|nr:MAG: MFS transporter [Fluviicola sp. XM-24bin1]
MSTRKPNLSFFQIWNMSFGFLGIQFGFALQGGFMSRIFQTLEADKDDIPLMWIAAPLTGLIVQPIIGYFSDRTWHPKLGRRRPYFLLGAILSSIALFFMPYSSALWMAAGFLWILDASINISMEPFRALVADKLNDEQRSYGFVVQTLIIGIGTWLASNLPWLMTKMGFSNQAGPGVVPDSVKIAFAVGAFVFIASILYTIFTTSEYPPEEEEEEEKSEGFLKEVGGAIFRMPKIMRKLGLIQFFSWFAFFTMWSLSMPALTEFVYNAPAPVASDYDLDNKEESKAFDKASAKYQSAADSVGSKMGIYGLSSMAFALLLTFYSAKRRINRKWVHLVSLIAGGIGFLLMYFIGSEDILILSFILIGFAWGSILSMPYAMLSSSIDEKKMGLYMGIFNMFIVLPQIVASLGGIVFVSNLFGEEAINAMIVAGISLLLAGLSNLLITDKKAIS